MGSGEERTIFLWPLRMVGRGLELRRSDVEWESSGESSNIGFGWRPGDWVVVVVVAVA